MEETQCIIMRVALMIFQDEWWDKEQEESMQCGVVFEIFKDKYQKDRVYKETYGFKSENNKLIIDDFAFKLSSLFINWSQYPGVLYLRCKFVDKYLGKVLFGNICTLTKENFKYLINNISESNSINNIINTNITSNNSTKRIYTKSDVMDITKYNFLNNIQVKLVNGQNNTISTPTSTSKPNTTNNNNNTNININN